MAKQPTVISDLYYVPKGDDDITIMAVIDGEVRSLSDMRYENHAAAPKEEIMNLVEEVALDLGYVLKEDLKPYTVTVTQAKPPYAPEYVLRLYAASEEDAKKKAAEWILSSHVSFAEEGHVTKDQLEEDVEIIDIPDDNGTPSEPKAASGRHTGLTVKATVTFQRWEGDCARFNGEAEFDACDALDSMSDEELAQIERNDPYALDNVYLRAVAFGQIHDYDGPFEVDLDEDNLSDYLEARRSESDGK